MWKPPIHRDEHRPFGPDALKDLRWFYVLPLTPALEPDDYELDDPSYVSFETPWSNISEDRPATAYTVAHGGKPFYRIVATGGETSPGSLMFTVPAPFRPTYIERLTGVVGIDGAQIGAVDVYPTGEVVYVNVAGTF